MAGTVLYPDTKAYIDLFYSPAMTSYEFLKSFFAALHLDNKDKVSRDLTDFFYETKNNPKYTEILSEFKFKSNGIFNYSDELEDGIFTLQNMGLLGKKNPSFGIILIEYTDSIAHETINALHEEDRVLVQEIAKLYETSSL